jgi:hypothetical protein
MQKISNTVDNADWAASNSHEILGKMGRSISAINLLIIILVTQKLFCKMKSEITYEKFIHILDHNQQRQLNQLFQ